MTTTFRLNPQPPATYSLAVAQPPDHESPTGSTAPQPSEADLHEQAVPNEPVSGTPTDVMLGNLRHPQLRLRVPLTLRVERENEHVTVWSESLEEIGYGPNLGAALEDFQQVLAELYLTLRDAQERLGPDMVRLWSELGRYVEERP